jgi:UDP-N-acetylenolpyruvoylglucosamine reductase
MASNINRKKFLQLSILTQIGLLAKPLQFFASNLPITELKNSEHVTYITSENERYNVLRQGFNKRIDKHPKIIALCKSTEGVAAAIQYAIQNKLPIAVKSGGHCMEGFSCNNGGMVINVSELNTIEWLSPDTIQVGPGCTLANIYAELLPKKKILPGGSCAGVGIGGLVLGGGYGLLARQFGLTCDSLQGITMVDGLGKTITHKTDAEVLWANKGGNNGNFGVATSLVFKVHTAPNSMYSYRFKSFKLTTQKSTFIIEQWFRLTQNLPTGCFSALVQNGKTLYILLTNVGKHSTAVEEVVKGLSSINQKTTKTAAQPLAKALKTYYGIQHPIYFKNASAGLYKSFAEIQPFIGKVLDIVLNTPGMIYQVNTLGGNIQSANFEKAAAFPHRAYTYFSELQTYWESPSQQKRLLEKFEAVQQIFASNNIAAQYRNYPDINFKNSAVQYYGENVARLKMLKNKYDPNNIFNYEQSLSNK